MPIRQYPPSTAGGGITSPLTTKGDIWAYSTLDARQPVGTDGQILYADSTQATGLLWAAPPSFSSDFLWIFGDGSSGNANFTAGGAVTGFARVGATYTCTATQVPMWNDVSISTGVTVKMANQGPFLCNGNLTMAGTAAIDFSGNNAVLGVAGVGLAASYYGTGTTGSNVSLAGITAVPSMGGVGGAGGNIAGGGGIGGGAAGGGATIPSLLQGTVYYALTLSPLISGFTRDNTARYQGGGSGAGGNQSAGSGGAGGAGGLVGGIFFRNLVAGSTGFFRWKGGNGGDAQSGNSGGGGGAGAGWGIVITNTLLWASMITTDITGGTGGAPFGTGNFGVAGSVGRLTSLILR